MGFEYLIGIFASFESDLSVPILIGMELAPFPDCIGIGCQGFIGPLPSAFLDKYCKELAQR
jgi:hypothetical protein